MKLHKFLFASESIVTQPPILGFTNVVCVASGRMTARKESDIDQFPFRALLVVCVEPGCMAANITGVAAWPPPCQGTTK
jgi:hypothetical protein